LLAEVGPPDELTLTQTSPDARVAIIGMDAEEFRKLL